MNANKRRIPKLFSGFFFVKISLKKSWRVEIPITLFPIMSKLTKRYRVSFWNRNFVSALFLLSILFSQLNFNYSVSNSKFLQKQENSLKKLGVNASVYKGSVLTENDDQSDFEEAESDDVFDCCDFGIQERIFHFFKSSSDYLQTTTESTVTSPQPLYILFCKLKIHLV